MALVAFQIKCRDDVKISNLSDQSGPRVVCGGLPHLLSTASAPLEPQLRWYEMLYQTPNFLCGIPQKVNRLEMTWYAGNMRGKEEFYIEDWGWEFGFWGLTLVNSWMKAEILNCDCNGLFWSWCHDRWHDTLKTSHWYLHWDARSKMLFQSKREWLLLAMCMIKGIKHSTADWVLYAYCETLTLWLSWFTLGY